MAIVTFRRYTNLASALDIVKNERLTLLNPELWDDRNDSFFLREYCKRKEVASVLALCFAQSSETYHHWRVYSHGSDGVCMEFEKLPLIRQLENQGVDGKMVSYRQLKELRESKPIGVSELPFIKRYPFKDEKEYRFIKLCSEKASFENFSVSPNTIRRITLSPWMPVSLADTVKNVFKELSDSSANIKVYRSTLVDNEKWKKAAIAKSQQA